MLCVLAPRMIWILDLWKTQFKIQQTNNDELWEEMVEGGEGPMQNNPKYSVNDVVWFVHQIHLKT